MDFNAIGECLIAATSSCAVLFTGHPIPKGSVVMCQTAAVQFPVRPKPCAVTRREGLSVVIVHGKPGTLESVIVEVRRGKVAGCDLTRLRCHSTGLSATPSISAKTPAR